MPDFVLQPTQTRAPAVGLFVQNSHHRSTLFSKLRARTVHYENTSLAVGDDWAVLFTEKADGDAAEFDLPWLSDRPLFLYQLGRGCLCELGYHPNIPAALIEAFIVQIRKTYEIGGAVALLSGSGHTRMLDLSNAQSIGEIDLAALS